MCLQSPQTNIAEALLFSAKLRINGDVDKDVLEAYVDEVMDLVELSSIQSVIVSLPALLSTAQGHCWRLRTPSPHVGQLTACNCAPREWRTEFCLSM